MLSSSQQVIYTVMSIAFNSVQFNSIQKFLFIGQVLIISKIFNKFFLRSFLSLNPRLRQPTRMTMHCCCRATTYCHLQENTDAIDRHCSSLTKWNIGINISYDQLLPTNTEYLRIRSTGTSKGYSLRNCTGC